MKNFGVGFVVYGSQLQCKKYGMHESRTTFFTTFAAIYSIRGLFFIRCFNI